MLDYTALGAHVRRLRRARGWSRVELAKRAFLSNNTIKRLELGVPAPTLSTLAELAKAFGVRTSEIVAGGER